MIKVDVKGLSKKLEIAKPLIGKYGLANKVVFLQVNKTKLDIIINTASGSYKSQIHIDNVDNDNWQVVVEYDILLTTLKSIKDKLAIVGYRKLNATLKVEGKTITLVLECLLASEFKKLEEPPTNTGAITKLKVDDLKKAINKTKAFLDNPNNAIGLSGMYMELEKGISRYTGTDGKALSHYESYARGNHLKEKAIIPQPLVLTLDKALDSTINNVYLIFDKDKVYFEFSDSLAHTTLGATKINYTYPNYQAIVPDKESLGYHITVNKKSLEENLKAIAKFSKADRGYKVNMVVTKDNTILLETPESHNIGACINYFGKAPDKSVTLYFNYRYLLNVLNSIKAKEIAIDYSDTNQKPVVFSEVGSIYDKDKDINNYYLIMQLTG